MLATYFYDNKSQVFLHFKDSQSAKPFGSEAVGDNRVDLYINFEQTSLWSECLPVKSRSKTREFYIRHLNENAAEEMRYLRRAIKAGKRICFVSNAKYSRQRQAEAHMRYVLAEVETILDIIDRSLNLTPECRRDYNYSLLNTKWD